MLVVVLFHLFFGGNSDSGIWVVLGVARLKPAASWSFEPVVAVVVADGDVAANLFFGGKSDGSMMVRKLCPAGWSCKPVVGIADGAAMRIRSTISSSGMGKQIQ
ncbi:hypothetical protein ZWY2020_031467 [Hordeum vulgare]|nr:hypothetical protein ZWY2020_031467 [Hordeum vulgare]